MNIVKKVNHAGDSIIVPSPGGTKKIRINSYSICSTPINDTPILVELKDSIDLVSFVKLEVLPSSSITINISNFKKDLRNNAHLLATIDKDGELYFIINYDEVTYLNA